MNIRQTETKPTVTIQPGNQISKVIINRVVRDMASKVEMVIRETHIPLLLGCDLSRYRRGRGTQMRLDISIISNVRDTLEKVYSEQIVTEDSTLKNLRLTTEQLEVQYKGCLANYGMTYEVSYSDSFTKMKNLFKDSILGKGIASQRIETLNEITQLAKTKMDVICTDVDKLIQTEANRLNSSEPRHTKKTRRRLIEEFARGKINELIIVRDQLKMEIQNEYTKYKQERITKSHEDHGPVAIL